MLDPIEIEDDADEHGLDVTDDDSDLHTYATRMAEQTQANARADAQQAYAQTRNKTQTQTQPQPHAHKPRVTRNEWETSSLDESDGSISSGENPFDATQQQHVRHGEMRKMEWKDVQQ